MLLETTKKTYSQCFPANANPYISEGFLSLNEHKADKIIRLMKDDDPTIGLIAGIKDNTLNSPFSAPFGGFHYSHEYLAYDAVFQFISDLKEYASTQKLDSISITLPPDIYQVNMNAKFVNAFIRNGYEMSVPNITHWINLPDFDGTWNKSNIGQKCRKAIKNQLTFEEATNETSKREAYDVIHTNRIVQERNIYMTFEDVMRVNEVMPVDFLLVRDNNGEAIGAGVFYRGHEKIIQGIFMGDVIEKRNLFIMDYMYMKFYEHYKNLNYEYIDLGTSSSDGDPNIGLVRFKEIHNCASSLKYTFTWSPHTP